MKTSTKLLLALNEGVGAYPLLRAALTQWRSDQSASRKLYGGSEAARVSNSTGNDANGRTFIITDAASSIRQAGVIRQIKVIIATSAGNSTNTFQFKLFRPNGTNYDFVAESEFRSDNTGGAYTTVTADLSQPMPCKPGDRLGIWIKGAGGNAALVGTPSTGSCGRIDGNQSTGIAAASLTSIAVGLCVAGYGISPYVVSTGDSVMEGHNLASNWHSHYHTGPAGNRAADIYESVWTTTGLESQNFAEGSATWATTLTKVSAIDALASSVVHVHCGVNDVAGGRLIAAVLADMDSFKAGLTQGQTLLVDEILPWTAGNDTQAGTVRSFNDSFATWCASNGAVLVPCHDQMGQVRGSTGELDDLLTVYNQDGVHITAAGIAKMAEVFATSLNLAA